MKLLDRFSNWLSSPMDTKSRFGRLTMWMAYGGLGFFFDCPHYNNLPHSIWCSEHNTKTQEGQS